MVNTKRSSKKEIEGNIKNLFSKNPTPKEIKKTKRLAMSKNIKLGDLRKKFCKKCLSYFDKNNSEIRIKNQLKIIKCKNCGYITKYKMKKFKE